MFSLIFTHIHKGDYILEVYFNDGFSSEVELLTELNFSTIVNNIPPGDEISGNELGLGFGVTIGFLAIPGSGIYFAAKKKSQNRIPK